MEFHNCPGLNCALCYATRRVGLRRVGPYPISPPYKDLIPNNPPRLNPFDIFKESVIAKETIMEMMGIKKEENVTDNQFWMVWSPQGGTPSTKHLTEQAALTEARRLAEQNPTRQFFVLKAIKRVGIVAQPVAVEDLNEAPSP